MQEGKSAGSLDPGAAANADAIRSRAQAAQKAAAPPPISDVEARWMREAAHVSRALIGAGNIGLSRAVDPAVQGLAQSLTVRHQALMQELQELAKAQHISLGEAPTSTTSPAPLPSLAHLNTTGGFDTAFVREVGIDMQTRAIAEARQVPELRSDARLAVWRGKYMDALRDGLSTAQQIPLRNARDKTEKSSSGEPAAAAPSKP